MAGDVLIEAEDVSIEAQISQLRREMSWLKCGRTGGPEANSCPYPKDARSGFKEDRLI